MSTRAAIRPRPLDNNKPLLIVKDVSELDPDAQPLGADNGGHGSHVSFGQLFAAQRTPAWPNSNTKAAVQFAAAAVQPVLHNRAVVFRPLWRSTSCLGIAMSSVAHS